MTRDNFTGGEILRERRINATVHKALAVFEKEIKRLTAREKKLRPIVAKEMWNDGIDYFIACLEVKRR